MGAHRLFCSSDYTAARYEFDSTRKPQWIVDSLSIEPIAGVSLCRPEPISRSALEAIHDSDYISAIQSGEPRELAESNCFQWDPQVWTMVCAQNGGAVASALAAMQEGVSGSLSTGMHHAYPSRGKGFCTFNGLTLAALAALKNGAKNVLILDLDAHCGGGTHACIRDHEAIWQIDVSVSNFDEHGDTDRSRVDIVKSPDRYLPFVAEQLELRSGINFGLCLYFSGMDPHQACAFGGTPGFDDDLLARREELIFRWCRNRGIPVAYSVGGGYTGKLMTRDHLVRLHRLTISEAAR